MNTQDDQGGAHALKRIRAVGFDENYESSEMLDKLVQLADGSYSYLFFLIYISKTITIYC